jgi:peptidoglycan hydrolase-like protein with peptidoglycan-binding domain
MINKLLKIVGLSSVFATTWMGNNMALAARMREYSPAEFRQFLRGFGYNITFSDIIFDPASKQAIREFQKQNTLSVTGNITTECEDLAADLVTNLHSQLNVVLKLDPPLPVNQFYGPRTIFAIKQLQKKYYLPETGIATIELRDKLIADVQKIQGDTNSYPQQNSIMNPPPPNFNQDNSGQGLPRFPSVILKHK